MNNIKYYEVRDANLQPRGWQMVSQHDDYHAAVSSAIANSSPESIVYVVLVFTDDQEELAWPKAVR